jgi:hypothetical protein
MNEATFETCEGIEVPAPALLQREHPPRYGLVAGLEEEELADPDELERQVWREELEPVLELPERFPRSGIRASVDEDGRLDWGAFGTVDFDRYRPRFDGALHKARELQEEMREVLIRFSVIKDRLPGKAKYLVLKYLRMGHIGLKDICNEDMLDLAKLHLRANKLRESIQRLKEASWRRRQRAAEAFWASMG